MKTLFAILLSLPMNLFISEISFSLPVELASFTASVKTNNVALEWQTVFENNNSGFFVERKSDDSSNWTQLGFVMGVGNSTEPHTYNYNDSDLALGFYNYRLKQVDFNNDFQYFNLNGVVIVQTISVSSNSSVVPDDFQLYQNFPNPFNPSTVISYELQVTSYVTLNVYDISGKEVATLVNERMNAGEHSVTFNAAGLSSGVYFYKLKAGKFEQVKRMTLVR